MNPTDDDRKKMFHNMGKDLPWNFPSNTGGSAADLSHRYPLWVDSRHYYESDSKDDTNSEAEKPTLTGPECPRCHAPVEIQTKGVMFECPNCGHWLSEDKLNVVKEVSVTRRAEVRVVRAEKGIATLIDEKVLQNRIVNRELHLHRDRGFRLGKIMVILAPIIGFFLVLGSFNFGLSGFVFIIISVVMFMLAIKFFMSEEW